MAQAAPPPAAEPTPPPTVRARSSRAGRIGTALIFLVPLAMLILGWSLRGVPNLPVPQARPGRLPEAHWQTRASLDTPRDDFGLAVVDGRVWVLGGMTGDRGSRLETIEIYDPATDRWSYGPNLTAGRSSFRAAAIGPTIYVFGGASTERFGIDTVEALDTRTGEWRRLDPLPAPRFGHAVVELNGLIYVIGGYGDGRETGTVYTYEPATNAWRQVASLPTPRYNLAAVALGGKIYAVGGWTNDAASKTVEVFDPATGAWRAAPELIAPISNFGATVLNGRIHTLHHTYHQVFDPRANKWVAAKGMPTTRHGQGVVTVGDALLAIGGCYEDPQYDLDTVEAYVPGEEVEPDPFVAVGIDRGGAISVVAGLLVTALLIALMLSINRRSLARRRAATSEEE
jgi:hypothetical protein